MKKRNREGIQDLSRNQANRVRSNRGGSVQKYKVLAERPRYLYPWSGPIPVLEVSGKPHELGYQIGTKASDRIAKTVAETWEALEKIFGCKKADVLEDLGVYSEKIRACHASFTQEMEGVAEGAKVSYEDIVMLNAFINLLHEKAGDKGIESLLCSSFASWGKGTKEGTMIMGHNDDGIRFTDQFLVLLDAKPEEGHRFAIPIIPGYLGYHTVVNDAGLCVVGNALENGPLPKDIRKGVPMWTIFRYLAQFVDNVEEGIDFIRRADNGIGGSFILGDKKGDAAIVHLTPNDLEVIRPKKGETFLAMTNHSLADRIKKDLALRPYPSSTHYRLQSMEKVIKHNLGKIDIGKAAEIMSTHYDFSTGGEHPSGNTPCRHYEYEGKFAGTCRSAVMELGKKQAKVLVALGNPCTGTWVELDLNYPNSVKRKGAAS